MKQQRKDSSSELSCLLETIFNQKTNSSIDTFAIKTHLNLKKLSNKP